VPAALPRPERIWCMADVDACFNTAESAETPLQLNIAAAKINSLDVLITEVLKNIEEEKFRAKIQPKPKQDGSLLGPLRRPGGTKTWMGPRKPENH
jgi:hypothetical protein